MNQAEFIREARQRAALASARTNDGFEERVRDQTAEARARVAAVYACFCAAHDAVKRGASDPAKRTQVR